MTPHILVIDDNLTNLKLAGDLLECEGHRVTRVEDAESALQIISRTPPDLILVDLALPGMDGMSLTTMLKNQERTKHIPIVALTAFAMKGDEEKILAAGCNGYISKPINTRTFPAQVAEFLPVVARRTRAE